MLPHLALFWTFQTFDFHVFPLFDLCRLDVHCLVVVEDGWHCSRKLPCGTTTLNAFGLWGFCLFWLKTTGKTFPLSLSCTLQFKIKFHVRCWRILFSSPFWSWNVRGHQSFEKWRHVVHLCAYCDSCCGQHASLPEVANNQNCPTTGAFQNFRMSTQRSDAKKVTSKAPPNGTRRELKSTWTCGILCILRELYLLYPAEFIEDRHVIFAWNRIEPFISQKIITSTSVEHFSFGVCKFAEV